MNREEAIKATRNGAIAGFISGFITLVVITVAIFSNNGELAAWNDPENFLDVIFVFVCAYGVYKKSRTAAIVLFVYFILSRIFISIEAGKVSGVFMSLVFLYFYAKAIQGAFSYKRIEKLENPNYKPASRVFYIIGIPLFVIFVGLLGVVIMTMTGILPSTQVQIQGAGVEYTPLYSH